MMRRLLVSFVALQLGWSAVGWACSCESLGGTSEKLDQADLAFLGTAGRTTAGGCSGGGEGNVRTAFEVQEGFKGVSAGDVVRIEHPEDQGGNCGVDFPRGETWLVFAGGEDNHPMTTSCWLNQEESDAAAQLAELRGE